MVLEDTGPIPMGRLAELLDVSVASATGIVGRMERRGLVTRRHGESDRRVVVVEPAAAGRQIFVDIDERAASRAHRAPRSAHGRRAARARDGPASPAWGPCGLRGEIRHRTRHRRGWRPVIALLRTYLRPYARQIALVVVLLLIQRHRQPLPADAQRRDHQQRRRQGRHGITSSRPACSCSVVTLAARGHLDRRGLLERQGGDGLRAATCASAIFRKVESFSQVEMQRVRPGIAHHPQHQRRPAGPDGRLHGPDDHGLRPDRGHRRDHPGGPPGCARCRSCWWSSCRSWPAFIGAGHAPRDPALPGHAGQARPDQPGHARDAGGRPGHPGLRPHRPRGAAASTRPAATCSTPRSRSIACSR